MIKIKGSVNVGHSYTGSNGNFEYTLEEVGLTEEMWEGMSENEKQDTLDSILDTEISNTLDAGIWVEDE